MQLLKCQKDDQFQRKHPKPLPLKNLSDEMKCQKLAQPKTYAKPHTSAHRCQSSGFYCRSQTSLNRKRFSSAQNTAE